MASFLEISGRKIGAGLFSLSCRGESANHHGRFDRAVELVSTAKVCGVCAIQLQTYRPGTLTLDCDKNYFWDSRLVMAIDYSS
jgi:pseudaminic acid synthase